MLVPAVPPTGEEIRAWGERMQALWDYFVQTTDSGTIQFDGDTASGRAAVINNDDELECGLYGLEPGEEWGDSATPGSDRLAG
jgi:hypothetical protein